MGCRLWGHTESDMTEATQQHLVFLDVRGCQCMTKIELVNNTFFIFFSKSF